MTLLQGKAVTPAKDNRAIALSRRRIEVDQVLQANKGRVPWSGGNEGVVVMLSDMLELVARS
jgi:hypothetical protein